MSRPVSSLVGLTALLLGVLAGGCAIPRITEPEPIPVASSPDRTRSAIREALRREGWGTEISTPGEVYAQKEIETVMARVFIEYDQSDVRIQWIEGPEPADISSRELGKIRRRINRALRHLSARIEYLIASADLSAE